MKTCEPSFEDAQKRWTRMRRPATFVGVPGYPWQPAVLWNAGALFCPVPQSFHGGSPQFWGTQAVLRELAGRETHALHIEFSFGPSFHLPDRQDNTSGEIAQELLDGRMPLVRSRFEHAGLEWTCETFSRLLEERETAETGGETLLTEINWTARNTGNSEAEAVLSCHLNAPHVVLGYKVELSAKAMPYLWHLGWERPLVVDASGRARLAAEADESWQAAFFDRFHPMPPAMLKAAERPLEDAGLHHNVLRLSCKVPADAERSARLVVPYFAVERESMSRALRVSFGEARAGFRRYWTKEFESAGAIKTPDPAVNDSFDAYLYHAMLATGRKPGCGLWMLKTSPNNYEGLWGAHAAIAAHSMDLRGKHAWSRKVLESFLAHQGPIGAQMTTLFGADRAKESEGFSDHPGFLGNIEGHMAIIWAFYSGWILWSIGRHARLTGDWDWFKRHAPKAALACEWIAEQRKRTMRCAANGKKSAAWGLLPAANAFDWGFGHFVWSDAYTWMGLSEAAECLREIGHPRAGEFLDEAEAYRRDIVAAATRARDEAPPVPLDDGSSIPYVPYCVEAKDYFQPDWTYVIAGALNLAWAGIVPPGHELVNQTLAFLDAGRPLGDWQEKEQKFQGWDRGASAPADADFTEKMRPYSGRVFHWRRGITYEPGWPVAAFVFMLRDELSRYFECFYSMISNGGQHVALRTPVEQRDGVPWTQPGDALLMLLMRSMLVREEGDVLTLAGACPRAWYGPGKTLAAENVLTLFGRAGFELRTRPDGSAVEGALKFDFRRAPAEIRLRVRHPEARTPASLAVDGAPAPCPEGEWLKFLPRHRSFVLGFNR